MPDPGSGHEVTYFKRILKENNAFSSSGSDARSRSGHKGTYFKRILKQKNDFASSGSGPRSRTGEKLIISKEF